MDTVSLTFALTMAIGCIAALLACLYAQLLVEMDCTRIRRRTAVRVQATFRITGRRYTSAAHLRAYRLSLALPTKRPTFSQRTGLRTAPADCDDVTEPCAPIPALARWTGLRPHTDSMATVPGVA